MHRFFLAAALLVLTAMPAQAAENSTTITGHVFADNWFELYVNGRRVAVDPIEFTPHNTVPVQFKSSYPMVYAIHAKDFAHPRSGLEYSHTRIGDGGLIAWFSDATATGPHWKCKVFFAGPLDRSCLNNDPVNSCRVERTPLPANWQAPEFDDSAWGAAIRHTEEAVRPHGNFYDYKWGGAQFIWTGDLEIDNTIVCRYRADGPGN